MAVGSALGAYGLGFFALGLAESDTTALSPSTVPSSAAMGTPTFGDLTQVLAPGTVPSSAAVGTPSLAYSQPLLPATTASSASVSTPSFASLSLFPSTVPSQAAVGTPSFGSGFFVFDSVPSQAAVGIPAFLPQAGDFTILMVNGTAVDWLESTLRIEKVLGGRSSASFSVYKPNWPGAGRPEEQDEVEVFVDQKKRFGGIIQTFSERSLAARSDSIFDVRCTDYQSYTDRVVVAKLYTVDLGGLISIIVADIVEEHLAQFGIVYAFSHTPPAILYDELFHYITATEALNRLVDKSPGYSWWIDQDKSLHFRPAGGTLVAPFSLNDIEPQRNWDTMTVISSDRNFRNRQWILPSSDVAAMLQEDFAADGSTTQFITQYAQHTGSYPTVYVWDAGDHIEPVASDRQIITVWPDWIANYQWYFFPDSRGIYRNINLDPVDTGLTIRVVYPAPFPLAFKAEDAASIAVDGLYEAVQQGKDVTSKAQAESLAQGVLDMYAAAGYQQQLDFAYNSHNQPEWLDVGQAITVDTAAPLADADFVIERVTSQEQELTVWRHAVTGRTGAAPVGDQAAVQAMRTSARVTQDLMFIVATFEIASTLPGIENPGLEIGALLVTYKVGGKQEGQRVGVISSWDILARTTPPTGADIIIDVFLNGTSIFPPDAENKMILTDGTDTLIVGYAFRELNIDVYTGDLITAEVLQVGSEEPGKDIVFHITMRV